jgi:hypothetical protein
VAPQAALTSRRLTENRDEVRPLPCEGGWARTAGQPCSAIRSLWNENGLASHSLARPKKASSLMLIENALNIFTDGSMLPSPRAGGIGIVFVVINDAGDPQIIKQFDRPGYIQATNNEMELEASIVGLQEALDDPELRKYSKVEIFPDSKYVQGNQINLMFVWPKTQ